MRACVRAGGRGEGGEGGGKRSPVTMVVPGCALAAGLAAGLAATLLPDVGRVVRLGLGLADLTPT